ncbi:hypothetical protein [Nocardiopsis sp. NRRL B-16309]|uniref:hypothetical protein n=1 Tax=Nocardiopsis sp. NRRL B-16309 TaxID=1519494 RepID=UPI0006AF34E0|nr:hypothetical protein [Nocardiopsis sp. NRRL B-16309]KOX11841.1 hypothetical protein ADL05_23050 [Nocardiopsis sp. NRRL B-16309]
MVAATAKTTTKTKKRKRPTKAEIEERKRRWSHQQGPFLGAFNAASAAMAVASFGSLPEVALAPAWPLAAGAVGATAAFTRAAGAGSPWVSRLYRSARWIGYTGWCSWALASGGPWEVSTMAALGVGTLAAAVLAPASKSFEIAAEDRHTAEERMKRRAGLAGEWEARINRICKIARPGVRVTDIAEWMMPDPETPEEKRQTGMSIVLELPQGSSSWKTIRQRAEELAADADLPDSCGIEVTSHGSRRRVLLLVSTLDALADDIPAGEDFSALSIYDPLPVGMYRDGSFVKLNLKWSSMALIGAVGSGKSAHLSLIIRQLLRCTDTLVMGVDFNGGKAFLPFLRPWLEGKTAKPAIDWVATTPKEAHMLLDFLLAAIPARSSGYAELMASANDDKVPSSSAVPHITFVSDETADLPREIKNKMVELSNRSRGVSIRQVTCALRAVSQGGEQLPKPLMAQAGVRTAMRVNDDSELQHMYGYSRGLPKAGEMPEAGYGLVQPTTSDQPRIFKGLLVKPDDSQKAAIETDERRPVMDEVTINAGRDAYLRRWDRAHAAGWLGTKPPAAPTKQAVTAPGPEAGDKPGTARPTLADLDLGGAVERARAKRKELEDRNRRQKQARESDDGFAEIVRGLQGLTPGGEVPRLLAVAIEQATDKGVHTRVLEATTKMPGERIRELLAMIGLTPDATTFRMHPGSESPKLRGYRRTELDRVAAEIELGDIQVPEEVRDAL